MFHFGLYNELSFAQIISSHCTFFLMHILKMMKNGAMTLQPTTEYSALLHILLFTTPLFPFLFSTIPLPPLVLVYAHFFVLPFFYYF
jgi:hypothetical protein